MLPVTYCAAPSICRSAAGRSTRSGGRSTGRTWTLTVLTSGVRLSIEASAVALVLAGLGCWGPSQPLSQSTEGTTIMRPAISPRTAAPICWRNQRWSSWTAGWRQVDGIGIGSSSMCGSVSAARLCSGRDGGCP